MATVTRKQTLVQLNEDLLARLDAMAQRQRSSRSAVIREAVEMYLAADREAELDRQIVEAYTRMPQTQEELDWADHDSEFWTPYDPG